MISLEEKDRRTIRNIGPNQANNNSKNEKNVLWVLTETSWYRCRSCQILKVYSSNKTSLLLKIAGRIQLDQNVMGLFQTNYGGAKKQEDKFLLLVK